MKAPGPALYVSGLHESTATSYAGKLEVRKNGKFGRPW
jgi:hypothetical protein